MCGIAGFWDVKRQTRQSDLLSTAKSMTDSIAYRGPDGDGHWADEETGIALGHRRLAIIDLSEAGFQPMVSPSSRYICIYNGEMYNFQSVRDTLEQKGYGFRGHSDTEVMLAAIEEWGFAPAIQKFNGMFAIALWDRQERKLLLARDRLGKKPLYYGWSPDKRHFFFGSELKALRTHPAFVADINREALPSYVALNYIPAPLSIYRGIQKLSAGAWLEVTETGDSEQSFWTVRDGVLAAEGAMIGDEADAIDELETLLNDSIRLRMISDVPVGAFLSGGIDSSLIVALAAKQTSHPVKTFSIGFEEEQFNEAHYAREVANHLSTDHTEFTLSQPAMLDIVPALPQMFDEPFADSSQIPTYCVSAMARKEVVVALSGDGGDEVFGGYNKYQRAMRIAQPLFGVPQFARSFANVILKPCGGKAARYADILSSRNDDELFANMTTFWKNPGEILAGGPTTILWPPSLPPSTPFLSRMQYADIMGYLEGDILAKVDRACMAASLEGRAPFLDYRLVDFSWRLPQSMKIRDGKGKWILRQLLKRHIPEGLFERPKKGFSIPQGAWLRGPLKAYAEDLLSEKALREQGYFDVGMVRSLWHAHLAGTRDYSDRLWGILMFQAWHKHWIG